MGLYVGAIYINATQETVNQKTVAEFIQKYWLKLGAKESNKNPLEFWKLDETGDLGFAITPVKKDTLNQQWIGIYDSEGWKADAELAEALAIYFGEDVWLYEIDSKGNHTHATKYGKKKKNIRQYEKTLALAESLPYPLLTWHKFKEEVSLNEIKDFIFLAFEDIPYRPNADYSGPNVDFLINTKLVDEAKQYIDALNADELIKLVDNNFVYSNAIRSAIDKANPSNPKELAFIYRLANIAIQKRSCFCSVLEAALRMKDEDMFEAAISILHKLDGLGEFYYRAIALGEKKEFYIAFRLLEGPLYRTNYKDLIALNTILEILLQIIDNTEISPQRLKIMLEKSFIKGSEKPVLFHKLARVYVKLNNYDMALQCIEAAIKYRYRSIDKLKTDSHLNPIKSDPRFNKAFEINES